MDGARALDHADILSLLTPTIKFRGSINLTGIAVTLYLKLGCK